MKKVIISPNLPSIPVCNLRGNEILAYKCPDSKQIMMLTRIFGNTSVWQWGFVPVGCNKYPASFIGRTQIDAATRAASERNVYAFDNVKEFSKALFNETIQ